MSFRCYFVKLAGITKKMIVGHIVSQLIANIILCGSYEWNWMLWCEKLRSTSWSTNTRMRVSRTSMLWEVPNLWTTWRVGYVSLAFDHFSGFISLMDLWHTAIECTAYVWFIWNWGLHFSLWFSTGIPSWTVPTPAVRSNPGTSQPKPAVSWTQFQCNNTISLRSDIRIRMFLFNEVDIMHMILAEAYKQCLRLLISQ